jgi:hypothetical protein
LENAGLNAGPRIAQLALGIATRVTQRKAEAVPAKLREMLDLVSAQPLDFQVSWSWTGTEHFVKTNEGLAPVREWLLSLFQALQAKDRAALVESIKNVTSSFTTALR